MFWIRASNQARMRSKPKARRAGTLLSQDSRHLHRRYNVDYLLRHRTFFLMATGLIVAEDLWCVEGRQEGSILESGITWSYGTPSYTTYSRP